QQEHNCRPAHLRPNPKPVAFRMKRAGDAAGSFAKKRENAFEIPEPDAAPRGRLNHHPGIAKNEPAIIRIDRAFASETQMETLERFATENEQCGQENEEERNRHRDPRAAPFAKRQPAEPRRAADDEDENS